MTGVASLAACAKSGVPTEGRKVTTVLRAPMVAGAVSAGKRVGRVVEGTLAMTAKILGGPFSRAAEYLNHLTHESSDAKKDRDDS